MDSEARAKCPRCSYPLPPVTAETGLVDCPSCTTAVGLALTSTTTIGASPAPPSERLLLSGSLLDQYQPLEVLGKGAFGTVLLAWDVVRETTVALKVLDRYRDEADRERFMREARTLARLDHPCVVRLLALEEVQGRPCLVMEAMLGGSLRDRLERDGRVPVSDVHGLATGLAQGLQACHDQGLLHRDLKPANILLDSEGRAKLADFGLVKPTDAATPTMTGMGVLVGTPHYMAPEQLAGLEVGPAADQYGLALVVWEMLIGRTPLTPGSLADLAAQKGKPPVPGTIPSDVSPQWLEVLSRALHPDPARRFATVRQFERAMPQRRVGAAAEDDASLWVRAQRRDEVAWRQLVEGHQSALWRLARATLSDDHRARDVVQQAFVQVFTKADQLRIQNFGAYLRTTVVRACLDEVRRRQPMPVEEFDQTADFAPTVSSLVGRRFDRLRVRTALSKVPAHYRVALVLRYEGGLGHGELARELGMTEKATERLLARARQAVARELDETRHGGPGQPT